MAISSVSSLVTTDLLPWPDDSSGDTEGATLPPPEEINLLAQGRPEVTVANNRSVEDDMTYAITLGRTDDVRALLDRPGFDINGKVSGSSYLQWTLWAPPEEKRFEIAQLLVDRGIDLTYQSPVDGFSAYQYVNDALNHPEEYTIPTGTDSVTAQIGRFLSEKMVDQLRDSLKKGDTAKAAALARAGADVGAGYDKDKRVDGNISLFMYAAAGGYKDVVEASLQSMEGDWDGMPNLELQRPTLINRQWARGDTAMHAAAFHAGMTGGDRSIYDMLKEAGGDENIKNKDNPPKTPLELMDEITSLKKRADNNEYMPPWYGHGNAGEMAAAYLRYVEASDLHQADRLQQQILQRAENIRRTLGLRADQVRHSFDSTGRVSVDIGSFLIMHNDSNDDMIDRLNFVDTQLFTLEFIAGFGEVVPLLMEQARHPRATGIVYRAGQAPGLEFNHNAAGTAVVTVSDQLIFPSAATNPDWQGVEPWLQYAFQFYHDVVGHTYQARTMTPGEFATQVWVNGNPRPINWIEIENIGPPGTPWEANAFNPHRENYFRELVRGRGYYAPVRMRSHYPGNPGAPGDQQNRDGSFGTISYTAPQQPSPPAAPPGKRDEPDGSLDRIIYDPDVGNLLPA